MQLLEPPGVPDGSVLVTDRHFAGLNPAAVSTDVAEFESALKAAAAGPPESATLALTRAVEVYGGELLPGHYDDWISPEQQRLDELYFQALWWWGVGSCTPETLGLSATPGVKVTIAP